MQSSLSVAFAVNDTYVPHLEIALFSLLSNNKIHNFDIYILTNDISRQSIRKLNKIAKYFGNANIETIDLENNEVTKLDTIAHFSEDIYSRYLLPDLLPDKDRVLYLDSDILVNGDIYELYWGDIDGYYVAGVVDTGIRKPMFSNYLKKLGLKSSNYINSGVLLMNLAKIRDDRIVKKLINRTKMLSDKLVHPDQDIINLVFSGKINRIDQIWNFQDENRKATPKRLKDAKIIHYTTEWKPWNTPNILRAHNEIAHDLYEECEYQYYEKLGYLEKISVIIPVYNTSTKYIRECVDSVVTQNYKDFEMIIVDDGSIPRIAKYLDEISQEDNRIKVIHSQNAGTNRARQIGFNKSIGKYITFVDSDDKIEPNMLLKLFRACIHNDAEMSVCERWDVDEPPALNPYHDSKIQIMDGISAVSRCRYAGFPGFRLVGVVWAKLYKRSVVEKINWDFSDYHITEDEFMNVQLYANVNRAALLRDQLYQYRKVTTSKESCYPKTNTFNAQDIPLLRTARDLLEKSERFYVERGIEYSEQELLGNYIQFVCKYVQALLSKTATLDDNNEKELQYQKQNTLSRVLQDEAMPNIQKLQAVIMFSSPESLDMFNELAFELHQTKNRLTSLASELDVARKNQEQFLGIKRSARLLAGNIKRKLSVTDR